MHKRGHREEWGVWVVTVRHRRQSSGAGIGFVAALIMLCSSVLIADPAACAEYTIEPAITVSEGYNDNILLEPTDTLDDYITRVVPSLHLTYKAPLWDWDLFYAYDYRYFAKNKLIDDDTHRLRLSGLTRLIKEFLFLDIRDTYGRTSTNIVRDFTLESLFLNQTDKNIAIVNPYAVARLSARTTLTPGYQYRNVWYEDPASIDKADHIGYADVSHELSARTTMTVGAKYTRTETDILNYSRTDLSIGERYEYAEDSSVWLTIGNSWFRSELWDTTSQVFWDAGIIRVFRTYTLSFTSGITYIDDPDRTVRRQDRYVADFRKKTERLSIGAMAGLWEYRGAVTKRLEERRYGTSGSLGYEITPNMQGVLSLTIDRFEDSQFDTYTTRYITGIRFNYAVGRTVTASIDYRYTDSYSPYSFDDNYENNRIFVEIKMQF